MEANYGGQSPLSNGLETGRNGKAAVCHLFQGGKDRAKKMADYAKSIDEKSEELLQAYSDAETEDEKRKAKKKHIRFYRYFKTNFHYL